GERGGGGVGGQPVGEVGRAEGGAGDAEADAVELPPFEHGGLGGVEAVRVGRIAGKVVLQPQPLRRQAPERPPAGEDVLPELPGIARVGIAAGHPDNRDPFPDSLSPLTPAPPPAWRRRAAPWPPPAAPRATWRRAGRRGRRTPPSGRRTGRRPCGTPSACRRPRPPRRRRRSARAPCAASSPGRSPCRR